MRCISACMNADTPRAPPPPFPLPPPQSKQPTNQPTHKQTHHHTTELAARLLREFPRRLGVHPQLNDEMVLNLGHYPNLRVGHRSFGLLTQVRDLDV